MHISICICVIYVDRVQRELREDKKNEGEWIDIGYSGVKRVAKTLLYITATWSIPWVLVYKVVV